MTYSISQVSRMTKLTPYTLRYYDREGLLPFVGRSDSGIRMFTEHDLEMISLICCLKSTGMPVKQIRQFIDWYAEGDGTIGQRRAMLLEHRRQITQQIEDLQQNLGKLDKKIKCYEEACIGQGLPNDHCQRSSAE